MSEKGLVRARGQTLRSPNTGPTEPRRAVHYPALHSCIDYFFGPELGLYQNSLALRRSILKHVSICSPSQFVHLHRKPYRLFFERELDGTAPIYVRSVRLHNSFTRMGNHIDYFSSGSSMEPHRFMFDLFAFTICSPAWETVSIVFRAGARWNRTDLYSVFSRSQFVHLHGKPYLIFFERELDGTAPNLVRVIATIGITHGRKNVSPSRNPCDSVFFWSQTHNRAPALLNCSPSWDPHRVFLSGRSLNGIAQGKHLSPSFLSTVEHRLAADRSNQIFLYARSRIRRHLRC